MAEVSQVPPVNEPIQFAFTESQQVKSRLSGLAWLKAKWSYFWNTPPVWKKNEDRAEALFLQIVGELSVPNANKTVVMQKYTPILAVAGDKVSVKFGEILVKTGAWRHLSHTGWTKNKNIFTRLNELSTPPSGLNLLQSKLQQLRDEAQTLAPNFMERQKYIFQQKARQFLEDGGWPGITDEEKKNLSFWYLGNKDLRERILHDATEFFTFQKTSADLQPFLYAYPEIEAEKNIFESVKPLIDHKKLDKYDDMNMLYLTLQENWTTACRAAKKRPGKKPEDSFTSMSRQTLSTFASYLVDIPSPTLQAILLRDAIEFFSKQR